MSDDFDPLSNPEPSAAPQETLVVPTAAIDLSTSSYDFQKHWDTIKDLIGKEKKVAAMLAIKELETKISEQLAKDTNDADTAAARSVEELMKAEKIIIARTKFEGQEVIDLLAEANNNEGWTLAKRSSGIDTYFRVSEGSEAVQLKMIGVVDAPAIHVLAVMNEIDLWNRWIPTVHTTDTLLQISPFAKIVHCTFKFPLPLSVVVDNRDALYYVYGVDLLEDKQIVAIARNLTTEEEERFKVESNFTSPPPPPKHTRMSVKFGGMVMSPVSVNSTKLILLTQVDPKVKLPMDLINWGTKKFAYLFYVMLRKQTAKLDKIYVDRIETNVLYKTAIERAIEWIDQHPEDESLAGMDKARFEKIKQTGDISEFLEVEAEERRKLEEANKKKK